MGRPSCFRKPVNRGKRDSKQTPGSQPLLHGRTVRVSNRS